MTVPPICVQDLRKRLQFLQDHPALQTDDQLIDFFQRKIAALLPISESAELDPDHLRFYEMTERIVIQENKISPFIRQLVMEKFAPRASNASVEEQNCNADVKTLLALIDSLKRHPAVQQAPEIVELLSHKAEVLSYLSESVPLDADDQGFYEKAQRLITPHNELSPFIRKMLLSESTQTLNGLKPQMITPSHVRIDTSGKEGEDAQNVRVILSSRGAQAKISWLTYHAFLELPGTNSNLLLRAVGGQGKKGAKGADGRAGHSGANGINATRFAPGTNGAQGAPGEPGKNGQDGHNGGRGGHISIYVDPKDTDLLMFIDTSPQTEGGIPGLGGEGGRGGQGGPGGIGGQSHHSTEIISDRHWVYDYTNKTNRLESRSTTKTYFQPGGTHGLPGCRGKDGLRGNNGKKGVDGSFTIFVGKTAYKTLYHLELHLRKITDLSKGNPEDIYEPGETIHLEISIRNTGQMPTPPQNLKISLSPESWIEEVLPSSPLQTSTSLASGAVHSFSTPLSFRIKNLTSDSEEPFSSYHTLRFSSLLTRVGKSVPSVDKQQYCFLVRYPICISPLEAKSTLDFRESILRLSLQNIGSIRLGREGEQKRQIWILFEIEETHEIKLTDIELFDSAEKRSPSSNRTKFEVKSLLPKSEQILEMFLRITTDTVPAQFSVLVCASLYLDDFDFQSRCIQKQRIDLRKELEVCQ